MNDGFALQLFRSNVAAVAGSVNLAVFILPYVITYILAEDQHSNLVSINELVNGLSYGVNFALYLLVERVICMVRCSIEHGVHFVCSLGST